MLLTASKRRFLYSLVSFILYVCFRYTVIFAMSFDVIQTLSGALISFKSFPGSFSFCCLVVFSTRRFVLPCVILFLYFSVLSALLLLCLGKTELILVFFVRSICALVLSVSSSSSCLGWAAACAVVPVLVLFFVALWFILRGDLLYVFPCVILFLCFSVLLVLRLPRLGKRELISVLFVRLFDLCLFGFVGFLFLLGSGKGCGL